MTDDTNTPENTGRDSETGRFAPGNQLGGKPKGARHRTTLAVEALLEGDADKLTRKAIEKALEGDVPALRLCLERIAPARKDAPVTFELPPIKSAGDAVEASSALLEAVASGEVTPGEGAAVMSLLSAHKAIVETCELEARLAALEARGGVGR